jgi:hypothetical protein
VSLSISEKRGNILVDFILDDVAQFRPLYVYQISRRDAFEGIVVLYASSDTGWTSGSRWRADKGFTAPHLGTTENRRT